MAVKGRRDPSPDSTSARSAHSRTCSMRAAVKGCTDMSCANNSPDTSDLGRDAQAEFREILNTVAHGFEGTAERNRPRLLPFVNYFPTHLGPILDVGCGVGLMTELLTAAGAAAVGIDQDPGQAAIAQSNGLRVVTAHAHEYLAHRPNEYGGIFLRHVLEHFDGVEGVRLLYLCRKALKPGGIIVIVTPNFDVASGNWIGRCYDSLGIQAVPLAAWVRASRAPMPCLAAV